MTEKEKAHAGFLYDGNYAEDLAKERKKCTELCHEYNLMNPNNIKEKEELLCRIVGEGYLGKNVVVTAPFWCDYGYNLHFGDWFYSNHNLIINDCVSVYFGNHVFIGPNVVITTAEHALDVQQRIRGYEIAKPVKIGDNVWIGAGCVILGGATIGDNCVIGAGSVVKKDIPANMIAVGVPCKPLRKITDEDREKYPFAPEYTYRKTP